MKHHASSKKKSASSPKDLLAADDKLRIFIDPASISSGFAVFKGKELQFHGTVNVNKKDSVFKRLSDLQKLYKKVFKGYEFDEVHIEQLPRRCHIYTHWSVAIIGTFLSTISGSVAGDIPVKSWQKATSWERKSDKWSELGYSSEDEFAAVCMGYFWTEKYL